VRPNEKGEKQMKLAHGFETRFTPYSLEERNMAAAAA